MRRALVPLVDASRANQALRLELREAFERALHSIDMLDGGEVAQFERALALETGTQRVAGVSGPGAAVQIVLEAAGIGRGDEVLVPANTTTTVALAVAEAGATPVIVDIDPMTALVAIDAADAAISSRTAALVGVDAYGQAIDGERISDFAARRGLFVLEDATHALHAAWDGIPAGALGDAAVFSFAPGDSLGSLTIGAGVATNDVQLGDRARRLRTERRMGELDAALVTVTLRHAGELVAQRREAARWYIERLATEAAVAPLETNPRADHAYDTFVVRVPDRDRVLGDLDDSGIDAVTALLAPLHRRTGFTTRTPVPGAEALASAALSLPLFPGMAEWQVELTVAILTGLVRLGGDL
jgi:dTDP-4-amino-4,6-dideoxygalactose transaminase